MRYTVNDMTAYGIYNGFSEFDAALNELLDKDLSLLLENDLGGYFDVKRKTLKVLNDDAAIKESAMAYYVPNPVHEDWREEYKAYHLAAAEEKKAPGHCDIPDNIAATWVHNAASLCLQDYIAKRIQELKRVIDKAERQRDIPSPEIAQQRTLNWIQVQNEGGGGHVPHIINCVEYQRTKALLNTFESYKPSLQAQISLATNKRTLSGVSSLGKITALDNSR